MNCSFCASAPPHRPVAIKAVMTMPLRFIYILLVGSIFLRAIARCDPLFLRVLRRGGLDHRAYQLLVRIDPVADHLPLSSVPLLELHLAAAFVVGAGHLERLHEADRAELLQALL